VIVAFGCSTFITSQSLFFPTNKVLKILSLSNIQQMSAIQQLELFIHTYLLFTCKIDADNQLHNCVCGALSIKMMVLQIL